MEKRVSISVIIPTYNRATFVTKAIDSVLSQTYKDYEIIVVDDGSTDDTRHVLKPYRDRIRYIYQENRGAAAARNLGIKSSNAKWLAFLDSDDRWLPEKLSFQMECVTQSDAQVCFTNIIYESEPDEHTSLVATERKAMSYKVYDEPLEMVLDRSIKNYVQSMLVKRSLFDRVGYYDERLKIADDTRMIFDLALETTFAYITTPLTIISRSAEREGLISNRLNSAKVRIREGITVLSEVYFRCENKGGRIIRRLRQTLGSFLATMAEICCVEKNMYAARRYASDGLRFGGYLRTYLRCLVVLCFPWVTRWRRKSTWR